jgi:hypothetical protein
MIKFGNMGILENKKDIIVDKRMTDGIEKGKRPQEDQYQGG